MRITPPLLSIIGGLTFTVQLEAGGVSVPVRVLRLDSAGPQVQVEPLAPFEYFGGCRTATIDLDYQSLRWWWYNEAGVTREGHRRALGILNAAAKSGNPIEFGIMGEGLRTMDGTACRFQSRGLAVIQEKPAVAVYSFYKWP